jgi:phage terminase large subunit-like protein
MKRRERKSATKAARITREQKKAMKAEFAVKVRGSPPQEKPDDPAKFVRSVLGYEFTDFHRAWWDFTMAHRQSLLLAPRGHGKSTILTVAFTLHRVLTDPDLRLLICSNTQAQAQAFLREIRHHLEKNPRLLARWGRLRGRPWNESELGAFSRLHGRKEATITVSGFEGPIIARHYDGIVLDDVVDEAAAASRHMRERIFTWYYKELLPTLEPHGELHVLGTRYHPDDLYGRLIAGGLPTRVDRAILAGEPERALWEDKFPLALLRAKREEAGPGIFNAQYQNDVTALQGAVFRPEWIVLRELPRVDAERRKYQGVDLAIGTGERHDFFAHVTVLEYEPGHYQVVGAHQDRLSFEDQFRAIRALYALHDRPRTPVARIGVEANAYQEAMAQRLRGEALPVASIVQTRDKLTRALRLQGLFQTGRICFPPRPPTWGRAPRLTGPHPAAPAAAMSELQEQLLTFPDGDHDDLVDALEIAIRVASQIHSYGELPVGQVDCGP